MNQHAFTEAGNKYNRDGIFMCHSLTPVQLSPTLIKKFSKQNGRIKKEKWKNWRKKNILNISDEDSYHNLASHLVMRNELMYHKMGGGLPVWCTNTHWLQGFALQRISVLSNKWFASA